MEAEHYKPLLLEEEVIGFDYRASTPWEAREKFRSFFHESRITPLPLRYLRIALGRISLYARSTRRLLIARFLFLP